MLVFHLTTASQFCHPSPQHYNMENLSNYITGFKNFKYLFLKWTFFTTNITSTNIETANRITTINAANIPMVTSTNCLSEVFSSETSRKLVMKFMRLLTECNKQYILAGAQVLYGLLSIIYLII